LALPLSATTYFVDNCVTVGSDSNNGTSSSTPWRTVAKVNGSHFNPDDVISFRASCTWTNDPLVIPSSGTAGHVITFNKYGAGANPIFDGAVRRTDFTLNSGSIYKRTQGEADQVFQDWGGPAAADSRLTKASSLGSMIAGSWFWDGVSTLYVWANDSGSPNTDVTEVSAITSGLNMNGQSFLLFDSIDAMRWGNEGYSAQDVIGANNITVQNATSSWHSKRGFSYAGGTTSWNVSNITLQNNTAHDQLGECFWLGNGSNILVQNNTCYNSDKDKSIGYTYDGGGILSGIRSNRVTIQGNYVHDIYSAPGIMVEYQSGYARPVNVVIQHNLLVQTASGEFQNMALEGDGTIVIGNVIESLHPDTSSDIYFTYGGTNQKVYNNTIYAGGNWGVVYYGDTGTNNNFENNIILRQTSNGSINVLNGASIGTIDYNDYYTSAFWQWSDGFSPTTLATWQAKCSCDAHSTNADPKLNNPAGGDFTLQHNSPAIDAGANLTSTYQMGLNPSTFYPWGTLNRNSQGLGWDIGAFVFVQQIPPAPPTSLSAIVK
jgi:hypothetical protein